jgi:hypothetical protein
MLKDCTFLRWVNVKNRLDNAADISIVIEHLFQPTTPLPPCAPPIYGDCTLIHPIPSISALKKWL